MNEPIVEVAEVGEFWVPESHLARLVAGAKVRVRLGECPLVGRWADLSTHTNCHQHEAHGLVGTLQDTDWLDLGGTDNAPGHTFLVVFPGGASFRYGHYAAAELEPVEEAADDHP